MNNTVHGDTVAWQVGPEGVTGPQSFRGSVEVWFGDRLAWTLPPDRKQTFRAWPGPMRGLLHGWSEVSLRTSDGDVLHTERVVFGPEPDELVLVDTNGLAVMVDKWGLLQRPFEFRDASLRGQMADASAAIMKVITDELSLACWISFGTLLGAARSGGAIGHDSDVDLSYLSEKETPAEMAVELWEIGRALRAHGWTVEHKSHAFLTVKITGSDGGSLGIDVYATFFLDGLFYETATVRTPLSKDAVVPITTLEFEGRMLNAPASPEALLEISYGPNWKVPDPSFRHTPGPEIEQRFAGWFGNLWTKRRDWRMANTDAVRAGQGPDQDYLAWVTGVLPRRRPVLDIGAGSGAEALALAEAGWSVRALDYALPRSRPKHPNLRWVMLNLLDLRDVMTRAALVARSPRPQSMVARHLLETLSPRAREHFWILVRMALRPGAQLLIQGESWSARAPRAEKESLGWAGQRELAPREVLDAARGAGLSVVEVTGLAAADRVLKAGTAQPARWRLVLEAPLRAGTDKSANAVEDGSEGNA